MSKATKQRAGKKAASHECQPGAPTPGHAARQTTADTKNPPEGSEWRDGREERTVKVLSTFCERGRWKVRVAFVLSDGKTTGAPSEFTRATFLKRFHRVSAPTFEQLADWYVAHNHDGARRRPQSQRVEAVILKAARDYWLFRGGVRYPDAAAWAQYFRDRMRANILLPRLSRATVETHRAVLSGVYRCHQRIPMPGCGPVENPLTAAAIARGNAVYLARLLSEVGRHVPTATAAAWTPTQQEHASRWALAELAASSSRRRVPPDPEHVRPFARNDTPMPATSCPECAEQLQPGTPEAVLGIHKRCADARSARAGERRYNAQPLPEDVQDRAPTTEDFLRTALREGREALRLLDGPDFAGATNAPSSLKAAHTSLTNAVGILAGVLS